MSCLGRGERRGSYQGNAGGNAHRCRGEPATPRARPRLCACPLEAFAYNSGHHPRRLEAEREAARTQRAAGRMPGSRCLRSFGTFGPFRAADAAAGSKGALHRSGERNARKGHRMPLYEHVFLARQDISQTQVEALTKEYGEVIAEGGGRIAKTEYWGLKSLAF